MGAQIMLLSDELEKTRTAAKADIRRLSVELQGLRDEAAVRRNVRAHASPLTLLVQLQLCQTQQGIC